MTFKAATGPGVNPPPPAETRGFAPARCAGEEPGRFACFRHRGHAHAATADARFPGPEVFAALPRAPARQLKDVAFVKGPDGHWIETIEPAPPRTCPSIMWTVNPWLAERNDRCSDGVEEVHRPHSREFLPVHTDTPESPTVACSTVLPCGLQYASVFLSSCLTGRNRHQAPAPRSGTMGMGKFWT